ncbi:hypothetical protein Dsin_021694 [Dipteronia sinensis]|uniref:Uncharacterized protein n=1 Tax=Dipteronia sinensis TaxID=43782 RepID=A0AAE0DZC2_9ROSI|nr:hypothetical protein Dsin_021694 [Dipteronia sinensis]
MILTLVYIAVSCVRERVLLRFVTNSCKVRAEFQNTSCFLKVGFVAGIFWNTMTTDSEEETSVSTEFEEKSSESQETERAAVEREKKQGRKRGMEPVIERAIERAVERAIERTVEPMIARAVDRIVERSMELVNKRVMRETRQVLKREMREVKSLIGTWSTPGAPADLNVNPRPSLDHQITRPEERNRLRFVNKFGDTIFTRDNITDDNGKFVEIQLINTASSVGKEGYLSSIGVEILVLEGDLDFEVHEDWTEQQFNAKIVRPREGKGPLVKGKLNIRLIDGVGTIDDLSFNDISRWIKGKKFRLGARYSQSSSSSSGKVRIMEAISEPFEVKDYRTKIKNYLPTLDDEVWYLKKITRGRKFHTRLNDNGILTVRDFKKHKNINPNALKQILIDCPETDWKVMSEHADSIVDDDNSNSRCQEAEAYNTTTTTGPPLQQDSSGRQNDSNRVSSFQPPPPMSTPQSQVNPQLNFNDNHPPCIIENELLNVIRPRKK